MSEEQFREAFHIEKKCITKQTGGFTFQEGYREMQK